MAANGALLLLLLGGVAAVAASDAVSAPKFGYTVGAADGPENWGKLSSDYHLCSDGKQQSPINIDKNQTTYNANLATLDTNYIPTNATLVSNGYNVALRFEGVGGAGTLSAGGKNYTLHQVLWHQPSEHTLNGRQYPMEQQLVHYGDDGSIAVVAVLYHLGEAGADPFLAQFDDELPRLGKTRCGETEEARVQVGQVETRQLGRKTRKYVAYTGSLTAPPCAEGVAWFVLGKVRVVSKEQAAELRGPLPDGYENNVRPTQQLNGRVVDVFDEPRSLKSNGNGSNGNSNDDDNNNNDNE